MGFTCGVVGLPNVGKSTLFNALTAAQAQVANYPFSTIDPNVGIVPVPDPQLDRLTEIYERGKTVPTTLEFLDIAGLVRGASKGEGLGNQFLAQIRNVDAIVHIIRCFDGPHIAHVDGSINPRRDVANGGSKCRIRNSHTGTPALKGRSHIAVALEPKSTRKREQKRRPEDYRGALVEGMLDRLCA